ncbi:MAG: cytochrome c oxidase subunit family protein [Herminiimonas sp.]|nr:cytochrome c oxidase subunit family protein [Herminiimonas sp.]MDB5852700.1 cytochrome c oxidase subunit family protein [Herminiimonas sp.]
MNASAILKVTGENHAIPSAPAGPARRYGDRYGAASNIALWLFMAVATVLFSLFIVAYAMRMDATDWSPITLPWQVWLSTAILVTCSATLQSASAAANRGDLALVRTRLLLAGVGTLAFLMSQLWTWHALGTMHVRLTGNPAGSFFYLLTAVHGLHVAGGLVALAIAGSGARRRAGQARCVLRMALCARYWHFLLAVWVVLLGTLGWLTPEVVRFICGTG